MESAYTADTRRATRWPNNDEVSAPYTGVRYIITDRRECDHADLNSESVEPKGLLFCMNILFANVGSPSLGPRSSSRRPHARGVRLGLSVFFLWRLRCIALPKCFEGGLPTLGFTPLTHVTAVAIRDRQVVPRSRKLPSNRSRRPWFLMNHFVRDSLCPIAGRLQEMLSFMCRSVTDTLGVINLQHASSCFDVWFSRRHFTNIDDSALNHDFSQLVCSDHSSERVNWRSPKRREETDRH